jgi:hypothetical protein
MPWGGWQPAKSSRRPLAPRKTRGRRSDEALGTALSTVMAGLDLAIQPSP